MDNNNTMTADEVAEAADVEALNALMANDGAEIPADSAQTDGDRAPEADDFADDNDGGDGKGAEDPTKKPQSKDDKAGTSEAGKDGKDKEPSKYTKARERAAKTWQEINAEKEALKAEKEKVAKAWEELEQKRTQAPQTPTYTADEYRTAATSFEAQAEKLEADGKFDEADAKRTLAKLAREQAEKAPAKSANQAPDEGEAQARMLAAQKAALAQAKEELPDLAKKGSPLNTRVTELLRANPDLLDTPRGAYFAAHYAAEQLAASEVPALREKIAKYEQRISELEQAVSVSGSGTASTPPASRDFKDLSPAEQQAWLEREANS